MNLRVWPLVLALALTGCGQGFFTESGTLASAGDRQHTWQWQPNGCTRDPFDGLPDDKTSSIAALLWQDPNERDNKIVHRRQDPDVPIRLEFSRTAAGSPDPVVATLHSFQNAGRRLDSNVCSTLSITAQQQPAFSAGTRPSLSGDVHLDCHVDGSHLTANIHFDHCDY